MKINNNPDVLKRINEPGDDDGTVTTTTTTTSPGEGTEPAAGSGEED